MRNRRVTIFTINDVWYDQRIIKIATDFTTQGFDVVWYAREKSSNIKNANFPFQIKRNHFLLKKGIMLYLEYVVRQFWYLMMNKKSGYVYCCDPDTLTGVLIWNMFSKQNIIYDAHEYFSETPELSGKVWKKRIWSTIEKLGAKHAICNITVAPHLAEKLTSLYGKPFEVVLNAPRKGSGMPLNKKQNTIIYQGMLNAGRGLECAIEAMAFLPDHQLWICGSGDIEDALRQKAKGVGNVHFYGMLSPDQLQKKTEGAKFGLNLLDLSSQSYYYSLANKFFDYAAAGVVSINSPGIEYLEFEKRYAHSLILQDLNPKGLAEAIRSLSDEAYRQKVENGLRMTNEHFWQFEKIILKYFR